MSGLQSLRFSRGDTERSGGYSFYVKADDGGAVIRYRHPGEREDVTFRTSSAAIDEFSQVAEKLGLKSWDGFSGSDADTSDGDSFSCEICYTDGYTVKARSYTRYPGNFAQAESVFEDIMKKLAHGHLPDYDSLCGQCSALTDGVPHLTANLANVSALIFGALADLNWAGFYLMEDGVLVLGPFQGKPACIELKVGKNAGVCGTAAYKNETIVVYDVHEFSGHIACDADSASEIVIPLRKNGVVAGVLDIDSPIKGRFSADDRAGLERIAKITEALL